MIKSASTQDLFQPAVRNMQLLIIARLLRQAPFIRDLDELFEGLARALVCHYHVRVAQFWVTPGDSAASSSLMLRALECQNERLVGPVLVNERVVAVAEHVMEMRRDIPLRRRRHILRTPGRRTQALRPELLQWLFCAECRAAGCFENGCAALLGAGSP